MGKNTKPLVSPNRFAVFSIEVDKEIKLDTSYDVHNITKESIVYHQYKNIRSLYISDAQLELDSRKKLRMSFKMAIRFRCFLLQLI
jgi:hypothetical protein